MNVLAVDPGVHDFSYAVARGKALTHYGKIVAKKNQTLAIRARQLRDYLDTLVVHHKVDLLVVEHQYINPRGKQNPADLVDLITIAGALITAGVWQYRILVKPVTWKGSVPKKIHQARMRKNMPEQWAEQLEGVKDTDVLDAVGILLWALKTDRGVK